MNGQPPYDPHNPPIPPTRSTPQPAYPSASPSSVSQSVYPSPIAPYAPQAGPASIVENDERHALAGLMLGIIALLLFWLPILILLILPASLPVRDMSITIGEMGLPIADLSILLSLPISIAGAIFSLIGRHSIKRRKLATVALVISVFTLALSLLLSLIILWAPLSGFS